jgi:hypothetical protein
MALDFVGLLASMELGLYFIIERYGWAYGVKAFSGTGLVGWLCLWAGIGQDHDLLQSWTTLDPERHTIGGLKHLVRTCFVEKFVSRDFK